MTIPEIGYLVVGLLLFLRGLRGAPVSERPDFARIKRSLKKGFVSADDTAKLLAFCEESAGAFRQLTGQMIEMEKEADMFEAWRQRRVDFDIALKRIKGIYEAVTTPGQTPREIAALLREVKQTMSDLTTAVTALTAAKAEESSELTLVLAAVADFPSKIQAAVDAAVAAGVDPSVLAGIQAVTTGLVADHQAMVTALASPPPAVATPPADGTPAAT